MYSLSTSTNMVSIPNDVFIGRRMLLMSNRTDREYDAETSKMQVGNSRPPEPILATLA